MGREIESVASSLGCRWYAITMVGCEDLPKQNTTKRKKKEFAISWLWVSWHASLYIISLFVCKFQVLKPQPLVNATTHRWYNRKLIRRFLTSALLCLGQGIFTVRSFAVPREGFRTFWAAVHQRSGSFLKSYLPEMSPDFIPVRKASSPFPTSHLKKKNDSLWRDIISVLVTKKK